jgi:hypothetical protein
MTVQLQRISIWKFHWWENETFATSKVNIYLIIWKVTEQPKLSKDSECES